MGKASSYDLLFPSGSSRSHDDTEPGHRVVWMAIILGDVTMANGTVNWFNPQKGFGFIAPEHGSKDIFIHITALERAGTNRLENGLSVTFDIEYGRDSATNLALA